MSVRVHSLVLLVCLLPWLAAAQRASPWREFRTTDGLKEAFCTSVTLTPRGGVLVRHGGGGLSRIDGHSVTNLPSPAGDFRAHESRSGQVWSLHESGLQVLDGDRWTTHPLTEVRDELQTNLLRRLRFVSLLPVAHDRVLVLLSDRLLFYRADQRRAVVLRRSEETSIGRFQDIAPARDGGVIVVGVRGLARIAGPLTDLRPASLWEESPLPETLAVGPLQRPEEGDGGRITVLADPLAGQRRHILLLEDGAWREVSHSEGLVRMVWPGMDGSVWFCTSGGLFRMLSPESGGAQPVEFPESRILDAAVGERGAFWLATPEGVFRHAPPLWQVPAAFENRPAAAHAAATDEESGAVWFVQSDGVLRRADGAWRRFPFPDGERIFAASDGVWPMPDGGALLDTAEGLTRLNAADGGFRLVAGPERQRLRLLGRWGARGAVLGTAGAGGDGAALWLTDGAGLSVPPFSRPPPGIGEPRSVFPARSGDVWLGGETGVLVWRGGEWQKPGGEDYGPESGACFIETAEGRVWCGSGDKLWEFDGEFWTVLRTGLERVNRLTRTRDGTLWVASNNGLERFRDGVWIQHGVEEGLPGTTVYDLIEDREGRLWAGTSRGLAAYDPANDTEPPRTFILGANTERSSVEGSSLEALVAGVDRWRHTPAARLLFSHRLNDAPWSEFRSETQIVLPDLPAGQHRLEVRAMDRNGNIDPLRAFSAFTVVLPWHEDPRLLVIGALGVAAAVFFAVLAWNRHRRLVRSHAEVERLVSVRTEQLARANEQLLHGQKMNALGTLAAGVAHDFNNILSIIKGSAQIIQKNPSDTVKIRTRADRLVMVADQGADIVRALLGFSRSPEREPVRCSLNDVVRDTLKLLGDGFLKDIAVVFDPLPGLPEQVCAKAQLQQMLLNIILNAADAMNGRGRVEIRLRPGEGPASKPVLPPGPADAHVTISVRDFGTGIPADVLPRIFEPFFTTKSLSQRRGTGLGLSMVYRMAADNHFGLAVETEMGRGTIFHIIVPVLTTVPPLTDADGNAAGSDAG